MATPSLPSLPSDASDEMTLTIQHQGKPLSLNFPRSATLLDLSDYVSEHLSIPPTNQKLLISPKPGLVKPPLSESQAAIPLSSLTSKKITLLGATAAQVDALNKSITASAPRARYTGPLKPATPARTRDWKTVHDSTTYTFLSIKPLPYLPRPERSQAFLERLAADPGIKSSMARHKWTVGLLTEMNPAEHTTHESRTLGLNRNRGEVIELRLRTDAYDGYRDYKTIRKTLCHELAHNVWGEHDRNFWDLCHEIEREVDRDDWRHGGHSVGDQDYYQLPEEEGAIADHGGWTGGSYVLGKGEAATEGSSAAAAAAAGARAGDMDGAGQGEAALSRRDVLAKAAEQRAKQTRDHQSRPPGPQK